MNCYYHQMANKNWFEDLESTSQRNMKLLQEEHIRCMNSASDKFVSDVINPKSKVAQQMKSAANEGYTGVGIDICHGEFLRENPCIGLGRVYEVIPFIDKKLQNLPNSKLRVYRPRCWDFDDCSDMILSWKEQEEK